MNERERVKVSIRETDRQRQRDPQAFIWLVHLDRERARAKRGCSDRLKGILRREEDSVGDYVGFGLAESY